MNSLIRDAYHTWRTAHVNRKEHPSVNSAILEQSAGRKHRLAVKLSLNVIIGGKSNG
jgi:hypothetical protein